MVHSRPMSTKAAFLALVVAVHGAVLSSSDISLITERCAQGSQLSWELGTRSQALLSLTHSPYSLFNSSPLPPPTVPPPGLLTDVFSIANETVANLSNPGSIQPLVPQDESTADPASIGIAVLLANRTGQGHNGTNYAGAATGQLYFLYSSQVPKTSDGAFSHRLDQLQLWSDFTAMVPPFLAYYGALTGNSSLLYEAYNQISLYRNYLSDPTTGLWRHIVLGTNQDSGFWATGNGWAAIGMLRVLSIIQRSSFSSSFKREQHDLVNWTSEILQGVYQKPNLNLTSGLLTNYLPPSAPNNFQDASSTALLAACAYRLFLLAGNNKFIQYAELSRNALSQAPTSQNHFPNGWLAPVVDPYSIGMQGQQSPEGQSFVLEMVAAWEEWSGSTVGRGKNDAVRWSASRCHALVGLLIACGLVAACC